MGKKSSSGVIVIVSNTSWSVHNFRSGLIRKLLSHGFSVWILAPRDAHTTALRALGVSFGNLELSPHGKNPLGELWLVYQLTRWYRKIRPDLILHYTIKPNIYGSLAARWLGIPSIACVTGLGRLLHPGKRLHRGLGLMFAMGLACSEEVWLLNTADERVLSRAGLLPAEKAVVLPGEGVDTEHFSPQAGRIWKEGLPVLLFAGRLLQDKGLVELAQAVTHLQPEFPGLCILLLGFVQANHPGGVSIRQIRHWEKQGIFKYLGVTDDVRPYLSRADALVYPSHREGMARMIMEASSMGIPVLTTESVGCADLVVDGQTGLLCRTADVEDLEGIIRKFIGLSGEARRKMGLAGRERILMHFGAAQVEAQYLKRVERFFPGVKVRV